MKIYRDGNSIKKSEIEDIRKIIIESKFKSLLEIGTYRGNCVFSFYDLIAVNNNGMIVSVDTDKPNAVWSRSELRYNHDANMSQIEEGKLKNIELSMQGSNDFFNDNTNNFDLIIIDGDRSYAQVKKDLVNSLKCLTKSGLIILHDYRMSDVHRAVDEVDRKKYNVGHRHTVHHLGLISKKEVKKEIVKPKSDLVFSEDKHDLLNSL